VRLSQRIKIRINPAFEVRSDIDPPSALLNRILAGMALFENRWLPAKPFGSSLFLVLEKKTGQAIRVPAPGDATNV
jgi:hypothetical protein